MRGVIIVCPECGKPNEVESTDLRSDAGSVLCWHCGQELSARDRTVTVEAAPPAFGDSADVGPSLSKAKLRGNVGTGLSTILLFAGGGLAVIALIVGIVFLVGALLGSGSGQGGGQVRGLYHVGGAVPTGSLAWQTRLARGGGFSVAYHDGTIYAAANEPRSEQAEAYTPANIPEDVLPRLRQLHGKMLSKGFQAINAPRKTAIQEGHQEREYLRMEKGSCYRIALFGGKGVEDADLVLFHSDAYSPIISDSRDAADANIEHCPEKTADYPLEIRVPRGHGTLIYATYRESGEPSHDRGRVYAVEASSGNLRWEEALDEQIYASPGFSEGAVVLGTLVEERNAATQARVQRGGIVVINESDGSVRCRFEAEGPVKTAPFVIENTAYFGSCGQPPDSSQSQICDTGSTVPSKIHAVSLDGCNPLWTASVDGPAVAPVVADGTQVYVSAGQRIYAIDIENGQVNWRTEEQPGATGPVVGDGLVYYATKQGRIHTATTATGEPRWLFSADSPIEAIPAYTADGLYAAATDGTVYAIEPQGGDRLWDFRAPTAIRSPVAAAASSTFVLAGDQIVAIGAEGTRHFATSVGGRFGPGCSPVLANGVIYVADDEGSLFALR